MVPYKLCAIRTANPAAHEAKGGKNRHYRRRLQNEGWIAVAEILQSQPCALAGFLRLDRVGLSLVTPITQATPPAPKNISPKRKIPRGIIGAKLAIRGIA